MQVVLGEGVLDYDFCKWRANSIRMFKPSPLIGDGRGRRHDLTVFYLLELHVLV
jgi:hypothetical protein